MSQYNTTEGWISTSLNPIRQPVAGINLDVEISTDAFNELTTYLASLEEGDLMMRYVATFSAEQAAILKGNYVEAYNKSAKRCLLARRLRAATMEWLARRKNSAVGSEEVSE